ncbi:MAG: porin [Solimicrobium sp.]|jgi:predicted porin|nr:porin [Solimicrobium sp.]
MKKSLLVGALLGAFGAASAQSSVTVYGTLDAGIAYNKGSNLAGKTLSLESGQQSYSRIGFKGKEDLGNGLTALFVLEQGVQINTGISGYQTLGSGISTVTDDDRSLGNDGIFSSQAYVGLSSKNVGTVSIGRQFSPLYESYLAIDPFMNGFAANMNNFFGAGQGHSPFQRMSNAVIYKTADSANLYGFKGSLAYGFGGQAGSLSKDRQVGISLGYANGPLTVSYAFHRARLDSLTDTSDTFDTHFIGATFDLGMAKIHGAFDQNKIGQLGKTQDYMVGVTLPLGANSLFADYTHKKYKKDSDANANQFAVGYTHSLSKRTNLYTAYTYVKNGKESFINISDWLASPTSRNVSTVQAGIRHSF